MIKKLILLLLVVCGGVVTVNATTLHIGFEVNYTGDVYVYRFGGTNPDVWESMGNDQKATLEGNLYGRRWYSINMNGNTSAIVRFDNWTKRVAEVSEISGDDCYMYVSTTQTTAIDNTPTYTSGKLRSKGWQTMKFSNDVTNEWDDGAPECNRVDDNTFTYTLYKNEIVNKNQIYFRFKLANGVFFVGDYYWNDHYYRIGSNDSQNGNVTISIAESITNNSYTTDQEKNWVVNVPSYEYEKLVFTISDVSSGQRFDNSTWMVKVDAYVSPTITNDYGTYAVAAPIDLSKMTGIKKAYYASSATGGKVSLTSLNEAVAANTGLFLAKGTGDISIPVAASGTDLSATNKLKAGDGTTSIVSNETTYYYGFQTKPTTGPGFYKITSAITVPVGKAYLELSASEAGNAPSFSIELDGETTGLQVINFDSEENIQNSGQMYDLQGRRVAEPTKGVYIVNGKKVIIK